MDTNIEYVLALLLPARPPPGHSHMMFPKPFHAARLKSGIIRGFLFWNQLRRQLRQPFWHEHAITKGSNCIDGTLGKSKGFFPTHEYVYQFSRRVAQGGSLFQHKPRGKQVCSSKDVFLDKFTTSKGSQVCMAISKSMLHSKDNRGPLGN